MFMVIIIILLIVVFLAFCGFCFEKRDKEKSLNQLDALKKEHNISLYFVTQAGYFAFCDDEKKVFNYVNVLSTLKVFDYSSLIKFDISPHVKGISCWALAPTYTEFLSGDVGSDKLPLLIEKVTNIIQHNTDMARALYYDGIFPEDSADVTVKGVNGYNSLVPQKFDNIKNIEIWSDEKCLYLFPLFNYEDYMVNKEIYKLFSIDKKHVASLSQEGNIHYTTEVYGGGGGGTSVKGAIVGGAIAGEMGAVIGSRKEVNPITSSTKRIDDRVTSLKLLDDNNSFCEIYFEYNDYYAISKILEI